MKTITYAYAALFGSALACPDHNGLWKRAEDSPEYSYEHPQDWGHLKDEYQMCKIGMQQAPLALRTQEGASKYYNLSFDYSGRLNGSLENSGTSLSFTPSGADDTTSMPSLSFGRGHESEDVYLVGWHLHTPSEHRIDGEPAKAEMHFVHADAEGNSRSVLAFLLQPSPGNRTQSEFFNQIPQPLPSLGSEDQQTVQLDPSLAVEDVGGFRYFWSYEGSLSTPPCTEGLRWFVAMDPLYVDNDTLQSILAVSLYSARPTQQRWMHRVNE